MPIVCTVPVVLIGRAKSGEDELGNDVFAPAETPMQGIFAPAGSSERVQGQDLVITPATVYLPTGTVVGAIDAVRVNGQTFEVAGDPMVWPANPFTGWQPEYSVEVTLGKVTG